MKTTHSVIKTDVGSIGGHVRPSAKLKEAVEQYVRKHGRGLLLDTYFASTGDDIAILMSHQQKVDNPKIHESCRDFQAPRCCPTRSSNMAASSKK